MGRIYGNIGFTGLWNGLPVRIVMIGTLTAFQWLMYVSFCFILSSTHRLPFFGTGTIVWNMCCYACADGLKTATTHSRSTWVYRRLVVTRRKRQSKKKEKPTMISSSSTSIQNPPLLYGLAWTAQVESRLGWGLRIGIPQPRFGTDSTQKEKGIG